MAKNKKHLVTKNKKQIKSLWSTILYFEGNIYELSCAREWRGTIESASKSCSKAFKQGGNVIS